MALSSRKQIETLADYLVSCADTVHARLRRGIRKGEIDRETARKMSGYESLLRQQADSLYIDAARHVVEGLEATQKHLIETVEGARIKIERISSVAAFIDLAADLTAFASAVAAGKPGPIGAALQELYKDISVSKKKK